MAVRTGPISFGARASDPEYLGARNADGRKVAHTESSLPPVATRAATQATAINFHRSRNTRRERAKAPSMAAPNAHAA